MNGILNVYKEKGYTSHDVVAKLRSILHIQKIGHTGTLDPDAVGVLPVCIGKATKLCGMITGWCKTYEAVMLLGRTTDTQDISGSIIKESDVCVSEVEILDVCNTFVGAYSQIPPMYSARRLNGRKLYELARQGIEVEREPREVLIKSLHVNEMNLSDEHKTVTFTVECSKGTYIRTLCDDIGKKLGCGACMLELTRKRVGDFGMDDTLTLSQIAALVLKGELESHIKHIDEMFPSYSKLTIKEEFNTLLYNGNKLPMEAVDDDTAKNLTDGTKQFRVYDADGVFIGIYSIADTILVNDKMFYGD